MVVLPSEVRVMAMVRWSLGLAVGLFCVGLTGCGRHVPTVTVYASQDQVYAEPILARFTRETGIRVLAVYDGEAVKTVGLANRLLAEKDHPQADVFWSNEELRMRQLEREGVLRATEPWVAFGHRSRQWVRHRDGSTNPPPASLLALTNLQWRGRVVLAYPVFGTTAAHFVALRQQWGEAGWLEWCRALQANEPILVEGNSAVVRMVVRDPARIGLTDFDDAHAAVRDGLPIIARPIEVHGWSVPNTVGVVRNAPHAEAAQALFQFLAGPVVREELVRVGALEGTAMVDLPETDWAAMLQGLEAATTQMKEIFLR